MRFNKHITKLLLASATAVALMSSGAYADTIQPVHATNADVLRAYQSAAERSYSAYNAVSDPLEKIRQPALKSADEANTKEIWATRAAKHIYDEEETLSKELKAQQDKANIAWQAADKKAESDYHAACDKAHETALAALNEAKKVLSVAAAAQKADDKLLSDADRTISAGAIDRTHEASKGLMDAAQIAFEMAKNRINEQYRAALAQTEQDFRESKSHNDYQYKIAIEPGADALAIAKEAASAADSKALKPVERKYRLLKIQIDEAYDSKVKPAKQMEAAAYAKRVSVWLNYETGRISADNAVSQLNALSKNARRVQQ